MIWDDLSPAGQGIAAGVMAALALGFVALGATSLARMFDAPGQSEAGGEFVRVNDEAARIAVYRDAKTGCEWLLVHGAGLVPRTAADGAGGVRQICNSPAAEDAS